MVDLYTSARQIETGFADPLLDCMVLITELHHHPFSADALRAGMPIENNQVTPSLLIRIAERAGFTARILKRPLRKISNLVLPAILLLENTQACVLTKINDDNTAELLFPESGKNIVSKTLAELKKDYTGYAIFLRPVIDFEARSEDKSTIVEHKSWFFGALWRYRYIYSQVILAAFFINIFTLIGPLFIMNVYDRVVPNYAETTLWVLAIGVLIIYSFDFLLRMLRSYLIDITGKKADIIISSNIFQHVLGLRLENKPQSAGAFASTLREFETLRDFFTSATLTTLIDLPFAVLFLILIWWIGGIIVLVPIFSIPFVLISALVLEKPLNNQVKTMVQGSAQKNAVLVESIAGLEIVKSLGAEGHMQQKWENSITKIANSGLKSRSISSLMITITNYTQQLVLVATMVFGVYLIHASALTIGGLIACNILASRVLIPLSQITGLLTRYHQAKIALHGLNHIMALPLERPQRKRFTHKPVLSGDIEFDKVTFSYPQQKQSSLNKVSFKIKAGEKVGIIGRVGSGKTTLQKLILGLYQPKSGNILLDGLDIAHIDPADLRRNIAYVPQDSFLFFGNVRENIVLSTPWADDVKILEVAKLAGVDAFVHHHPDGYDLKIGEGGAGLSGGQRQAIAIARAILSNAPICLFDEPTSSMDNATEHDLIIRLSSYLKPKTLLLVTHKIPLFALVDRLILMSNGQIILDGPRDQVLAKLSQPPPPVKSAGEASDEKKKS